MSKLAPFLILSLAFTFSGCGCGSTPLESGVDPLCAEGDCPAAACEGDGCVAATCDDAAQNGDETGVDCGGVTCAACGNGSGCVLDSDCESAVCQAGRCVPPTCTEGAQNGDETAVDCGGSCAACGEGAPCGRDTDCASGVCVNGACAAPTCSDATKNGDETAVDCGGSCTDCEDGETCDQGIDCASGVCVNGTCAAPGCIDGVRNGDETAVDCGGSCAPCGDGETCAQASDCASAICDNGTCAVPTCTDLTLNGDETAVDCGGSCAACADGETCVQGGDCSSSVCVSGTCAVPTCTDGARNADETAVDCGGSCPACGDGETCAQAADCASGICASGTCAAPTCTDGLKNGTESSIDCGGAGCPGCGEGDVCSQRSDCASGVCVDGLCELCANDDACAPGAYCELGACIRDSVPPTVRDAFAPTATTVRVRFSEPMSLATTVTGALNVAHYCIENHDTDDTDCTPTLDFSIASAAAIGPDTVDLTLSSPSLGRRYRLVVRDVVDLGGNAVAAPRSAEFLGNPPLTLVTAEAIAATQVNVVFSRTVSAGADAPGSAECSNAPSCAQRYALLGPATLGPILSATRRAPPRDNEIVLTHFGIQDGASYTVIGANGIDGDGFDDATNGAIAAETQGQLLSATPGDRASFSGAGTALLSFDSGPVAVDPFGDGSTFSYVFKHAEKVHLGPRSSGQGAVRMSANGADAEGLSFAISKDLNPTGKLSSNSQPGPFPSTGASGCIKDTLACGPDNEDGRGYFTSGMLDGREWLVIGASRSQGPLSYIYMSPDADRTADLRYVDLSVNRTGNAESFSSMIVSGGRGYLAWPDTGPKRPVLLSLNRAPALASTGLDAQGNGTGSAACDPAVHDSCNLMAELMPGVGSRGTPANTAAVQMIDVFLEFAGRLYLGNNGGLVRATVAAPLDYGNAPGHWTSTTPSDPRYAALVSRTTTKLAELEPADRALPQMATHGGSLFVGRNTTSGPQLWRCDPERVSGPAPATEADCDPGDWSLVAANDTGDPLLSQFNDAGNTTLALLVRNGPALYVGFNHATAGVVIFRTDVTRPGSAADFMGAGGCIAGTAACEGLGGNGFGAPAFNRRIFDATSLTFEGQPYLYVATGNGTDPVRIYRNRD